MITYDVFSPLTFCIVSDKLAELSPIVIIFITVQSIIDFIKNGLSMNIGVNLGVGDFVKRVIIWILGLLV